MSHLEHPQQLQLVFGWHGVLPVGHDLCNQPLTADHQGTPTADDIFHGTCLCRRHGLIGIQRLCSQQ